MIMVCASAGAANQQQMTQQADRIEYASRQTVDGQRSLRPNDSGPNRLLPHLSGTARKRDSDASSISKARLSAQPALSLSYHHSQHKLPASTGPVLATSRMASLFESSSFAC